MKIMKNLFITIEGCDGVGKSTVVDYIYKYFKSKNFKIIKTREPGGSYIAEKIRNIIMEHNITPQTEALLFAAARVEHIENVIKPALIKNTIIICDRYFDSSIVYQGYARNLDIKYIKEINSQAIDQFSPTLTIILDANIKTIQDRIKKNLRKTNRFDDENLQFHTKCVEGFKNLATIFPQRNIKYVDANKDKIFVQKNIIKLINEVLNNE